MGELWIAKEWCKPSTSVVQLKGEKCQEFASWQYFFCICTTSVLDVRINKQTVLHSWKSTMMENFMLWISESKISFLAILDRNIDSFQWWLFEAVLKPFPLRFWKRWRPHCIEESWKILNFRLLQVFSYLGDPDVVSVASVCLQWAGQ